MTDKRESNAAVLAKMGSSEHLHVVPEDEEPEPFDLLADIKRGREQIRRSER